MNIDDGQDDRPLITWLERAEELIGRLAETNDPRLAAAVEVARARVRRYELAVIERWVRGERHHAEHHAEEP